MSVKAGASVEELEQLYRGGFRKFARVAIGITGSLQSGQDAVQEAFVSCLRSRRSYRGDATVEAWVWRAVVNSALKIRRGQQELPSEDVLVEQSSGDDDPVEVERVRDAVRRLPERERLTLFLRYYADLDYRTIAETLGVNAGTVAAALHAAHKTIQHQLEEVRQ